MLPSINKSVCFACSCNVRSIELKKDVFACQRCLDSAANRLRYSGPMRRFPAVLILAVQLLAAPICMVIGSGFFWVKESLVIAGNPVSIIFLIAGIILMWLSWRLHLNLSA